ncbi:GntR family transcriptional regulator [Nocardioides flavus (ex Wang et al. 2016)]|uniref:GntR family transcriptional regulator n=1 Tax=Nocardioides flavus (ex Wang et al. 2016) TaxID=2058780 RepID=A0ABQ3HLP0_9ACTN|nr:GntR family transcriptional regulator [Nocardioides flavus (ex Wang et al. 2016)]GHE17574.1 GntR family transcriptional regulator [Nocardioides flavus (ex Wang et al. 2016)]
MGTTDPASPTRSSGTSRGAALGSDLDTVLDGVLAARRAERTVMSTSADRAARVVREQVVEGHLRSGTRLPEERLAGALGVSRNTLREALSQLVAERILVREPHRGVVVATPEVEDVEDVYRVRRLVETAALARGSHHTPERVAAVAAAVTEGRGAAARGDWDGVASANQHFHRAVVSLAGSPRLDAQMDLLLAEMRLFFHQMGAPERFHRPYLDENGAIADLLAAGERDRSADRLDTYLATAQDQLVAAFRQRA